LKISSTDDRLGIDRPAGKPGILKHRTLTELLSIPAPTSPVLEATGDEDEALGFQPTRRPLQHTKSDTNLSRSNSLPARRRSPSVAKRVSSNSKERSPDAPQAPSNKRHISFNTFVEQVIALDDPVIRRREEDSDSDDVLEMRRSSRFSSNSRSPSVTSNSSTIAKIAPGILKTSGSYTNNPTLPKLVYMPTPEYRSPSTETTPAVVSPLGQPPALGQPAIKRWSHGHDDDYTVGFDYFGGPDLTGASPASSVNAAPSYGRAPAVQVPPAQPKWRQQSVDSSTTSTSSSSSSLNGLGAPQQQPARSILKVRPANPNPTSPEPVSPPVIFNYNPSVATGIGGMFGGYEGAAQAGISIGSPVSDREERGRSTSRGNGSSQYDRSISRGTSVSSSTSSLASVARSPVEATTIKSVARPTNPNLEKVQESASWEAPQTGGEPMDVDHSPDRSMTPTPHSSPQVSYMVSGEAAQRAGRRRVSGLPNGPAQLAHGRDCLSSFFPWRDSSD